MKKRFLSVILSVCVALAMVPAIAFTAPAKAAVNANGGGN